MKTKLFLMLLSVVILGGGCPYQQWPPCPLPDQEAVPEDLPGPGYALIVNSVGWGVILVDPVKERYLPGDVINVEAIAGGVNGYMGKGGGGVGPCGEWYFDHWQTTGFDWTPTFDSSIPKGQVVVGNKDILLQGVFVYNDCGQPTWDAALDLQVDGSGTVELGPIQAPVGKTIYSLPVGSVVSVKANPSAGWVFDHWEGGLGGTDNPISFGFNGPMTVKAVFVVAPDQRG